MSARDEQSIWFPAAVATLLVVAAALRFRLGASLFEDEVWVADLIRLGGLRPHTFSIPPLFYELERWWTSLRGTNVPAMRVPPAFFGVLLAALPFAATRLDRTTRFTWSLLLAFSSPLLFYSTRLKQYTLEGSVCTLLLILWIHAEESESRTPRFAFFAVALLGVTTLHTPGLICGAALVAALLSPRARHLAIFAGFALVFAAWAGAWLGWLKPGAETARLHGDMNVFFAANGRWVTSPHLLIENTKHWLGQAFNLVAFWWLVAAILVLLLLLSPLVEGGRKVMLVVFAVVPPAAAAILSARHIYPYGEVRLMIFAFPAVYLLVAKAFSTASRHVPWLLVALAPFVMHGVAYETYNRTYMHLDDLTPFYATIAENHAPGEPIYAELSWAAPLKFHHPELAADVRDPAPGPGWHVGRAVDVRGASFVLRAGGVTAARFEAARSAAAPAP